MVARYRRENAVSVSGTIGGNQEADVSAASNLFIVLARSYRFATLTSSLSSTNLLLLLLQSQNTQVALSSQHSVTF